MRTTNGTPRVNSYLPLIHYPHRQRGIAALTIALIIVVVATIVTIGVTQIGVGEQKNMANEVRNKQAGTIADMSLDRAANYLRQNLRYVRATGSGGWMQSGAPLWVPCASNLTTPPCGDGTNNVFDQNWTAYANVPNLAANGEPLTGTFITHFVARAAAPGLATPGTSTFYVISEGRSVDQTGQALIKRAYTIRPIIGRAPDAPIIAAGNTDIGGSMSIVANPNGGGPGVPLSIWSGDDSDIASGATMQSCHVSEYLSTDGADGIDTDATGYSLVRCPDCECPNTPQDLDRQISNQDTEGLDILDLDGNTEGVNPDTTNFPDDLFEYVFGIPRADYQSIKDQATIIADCSGLNSNSSGLYWVTGNCSLPIGGNSVIGSLDAPVALVVENGDLIMNGGGEFLGLIFMFDQNGDPIDIQINGGPTLYGALVSTQDVDTGNGSYVARYEKGVLENLANVAATLTDVPGSWKDYR